MKDRQHFVLDFPVAIASHVGTLYIMHDNTRAYSMYEEKSYLVSIRIINRSLKIRPKTMH